MNLEQRVEALERVLIDLDLARFVPVSEGERSVALPNGPERRESQTWPGRMTFTTMRSG